MNIGNSGQLKAKPIPESSAIQHSLQAFCSQGSPLKFRGEFFFLENFSYHLTSLRETLISRADRRADKGRGDCVATLAGLDVTKRRRGATMGLCYRSRPVTSAAIAATSSPLLRHRGHYLSPVTATAFSVHRRGGGVAAKGHLLRETNVISRSPRIPSRYINQHRSPFPT